MMILCACGCGQELEAFDARGRPRKYIYTHQRIGSKHTSESKQLMSRAKEGVYDGEKNPNWGKPRPKEVKRKISETEMGKQLSEITKGKMSVSRMGEKNPNWGKTCSIKTRRKISDANNGRKWTDDMRRAITGVNSAAWRGGISFEPYCQKFNELFKETIRTKFNRACILCGKTEFEQQKEQMDNGKRQFKLSIHHVNYDKNCLCGDSKCEFVPLCHSCHSKTNHNREYWEEICMEKLNDMEIMHSKMIELEAQARAAISAPETKEEIQDVESEFYPDTVKEDAT